jgi:predicted nucleic acid-binding protein
MTVVADTTPVNYLILIGAIDVLPKLYGQVIIPPAVREELTHGHAPATVRDWIAHPPYWLEVLSPLPVSDAVLAKLDAGEREAIALTEQLSISEESIQFIVDEMLGRREAEGRGLSVIGTIGVLRLAADEGLLDLRSVVEQLRQTSFHISPAILSRLMDDQR